jgi:hypothetical protein
MVLALDGPLAPEAFDRSLLGRMIAVYEETSGVRLEKCEVEVLPASMAAIPFYHAISAGFLVEPLVGLQSALPPANVSESLLDHLECLRDVFHAR